MAVYYIGSIQDLSSAETGLYSEGRLVEEGRMFFDELEKMEDILADNIKYDLLLVLLNNIPDPVFLLDVNHQLVAINSESSDVFALENEKAVGQPHVYLPSNPATVVECLRKIDMKVLSGVPSKNLTVQYRGNGNTLHCYLASKKPIYNNKKKIIGEWAHAIDATKLFLRSIQFFLSTSAHYYPKKLTQFSLDLDNSYEELNLPPRLTEVFFFLLRGKTSKEIAKILMLSPRTVEAYVEGIKLKLDCDTKSQIIEKGIAAGYLGVFPETLLYKFNQ